MNDVNNYLIVTVKDWYVEMFNNLKNQYPEIEWTLIKSKQDFTLSNLNKIKPLKIFIPHWSYKIEEEIFESFECIVFHMTDLPFGRGGSPLQNLIVRGFKDTKVSALKVDYGMDTGDIYLKKELSLSGTATEIFKRTALVIEKMICEILDKKLKPQAQTGPATEFKRRKPSDSNMNSIPDLNKVHDHIRMLDCNDYPNAYLETDYLKIEFTNAQLNSNNEIVIANVRISKK